MTLPDAAGAAPLTRRASLRTLFVRLGITLAVALTLAILGHATLRAEEAATPKRFVRPVPKGGWTDKQAPDRSVPSQDQKPSSRTDATDNDRTAATSGSSSLKWRPHRRAEADTDGDEAVVAQTVKTDGSRSVGVSTTTLRTIDPFEDSYSTQADPLEHDPDARQHVRRLVWQEGADDPRLELPSLDEMPVDESPLRRPFQLQPLDEGVPIEEQIAAQRQFYDPPCPTPADLKPISEVTNVITAPDGDFPRECPLGDEVFVPRNWGLTTYTWKASAVCHKPLYFEQMALERYGHSTGPLTQPFVSGAHFFATLPVLPYLMGVEPPWECIYPLGYYRPGSCAPYMLYPIPISARGALLEAGAWVGGVFLIP